MHHLNVLRKLHDLLLLELALLFEHCSHSTLLLQFKLYPNKLLFFFCKFESLLLQHLLHSIQPIIDFVLYLHLRWSYFLWFEGKLPRMRPLLDLGSQLLPLQF
jgi:hypothetical protein